MSEVEKAIMQVIEAGHQIRFKGSEISAIEFRLENYSGDKLRAYSRACRLQDDLEREIKDSLGYFNYKIKEGLFD